MADLILANDIENETAADAVEIEQNYNQIQAYINNDVIRRDGAVAMAAPLLLVADPSADNHAATKAYVDAILPVGVILPYGGVAAPAGRWALANGASVATSTYPQLHAVFGYRYGGSGGSFNLPNFAARIPVGVDSTQTRFDATGKTGGSYTMAVPEHSHSMAHDHSAGTTSADGEHQHVGRYSQVNPLGTSGGGYVNRREQDTSGTSYAFSTPAQGQHTHTFDVANYTGNTANAGTAGAEHLPPYVVVQYIVRLD